ncbi:MAG: nuclear transport factor 2 family protein [Actinomycetota bacterium]
MSLPDVAQRFIDAITVGDADAARACYAPDAALWHNFDNVTQTVDENIALMNAMTKRITDRRYVIRRLEPIEGGYLQQHTLELVLPDGQELSTEAVALVTVDDDGLIARIDEWLDPAPLAPMFR